MTEESPKTTTIRFVPMLDRSRHRGGLSLQLTLLESLDSLRLLGRRSLLALLGIAVGCAAVVALLNIGHNAAQEAVNTFKGMGTNTLVATFPAQPGMTRPAPSSLDVPAVLKAIPGIEFIAPMTLHAMRIRHEGKATDASIVGTTPGIAPVLSLRIEEGRALSDFDHNATYAVAGARIAHDLSLHPGSRLQVGNYVFEVIGISSGQTPNPLVPIALDESVLIPIEGMRRIRPAPEIGSIIALGRDTGNLKQDAQALQAYLEGLATSRLVDVQIPQQLLDGLTRQSSMFAYLLGGLGGISLIVGGVGVMNVMLMNVAERRREIGVRLALGAHAFEIRNLFLFEAATLSIAGALLGTLVGLASAYAFVRLSGWSFSLSPASLPLGILSSLATGLFFGLHPAMSAARLHPVQALRDD